MQVVQPAKHMNVKPGTIFGYQDIIVFFEDDCGPIRGCCLHRENVLRVRRHIQSVQQFRIAPPSTAVDEGNHCRASPLSDAAASGPISQLDAVSLRPEGAVETCEQGDVVDDVGCGPGVHHQAPLLDGARRLPLVTGPSVRHLERKVLLYLSILRHFVHAVHSVSVFVFSSACRVPVCVTFANTTPRLLSTRSRSVPLGPALEAHHLAVVFARSMCAATGRSPSGSPLGLHHAVIVRPGCSDVLGFLETP